MVGSTLLSKSLFLMILPEELNVQLVSSPCAKSVAGLSPSAFVGVMVKHSFNSEVELLLLECSFKILQVKILKNVSG